MRYVFVLTVVTGFLPVAAQEAREAPLGGRPGVLTQVGCDISCDHFYLFL